MIEVRVPDEQEGTKAVVRSWLKKVGESVAVNDPLVELETDKVTQEVPSPAAGILTEILLETDDEVLCVALSDDGTFDIVAVGRSRLRLEAMESSGPFLSGTIDVIREREEPVDPELVQTACDTFDRYRDALSEIHGEEVLEGSLPKDPTYLSWSLAATCLLTLPDRQSLLEAENASLRLGMLTTMLRDELRAITAIPSLPATELARTGWSPN